MIQCTRSPSDSLAVNSGHYETGYAPEPLKVKRLNSAAMTS